MRVFVGTMLGGEIGQWCEQHATALTAQFARALRAIPPGTAHLTHFFCASLGDVPLDGFVEAVRRSAAVQAAFGIRLGGLKALPPGPRPRLIVLEVPGGAADLARLSSVLVTGVRRACPGLALDPAKSAHVTLARVRKHADRRDARPVVRALDALGRAMGERESRLDRVAVVRSTLTESGPVYEIVAIVPLASGETPT